MQIQHLIDGAAHPSSDYFETINPATQEVLAEVARGANGRSTPPSRAAKRHFLHGPAGPP